MQVFAHLFSGLESGLVAFVGALLLLSSTGCDTSVNPIQENDLHYSIFGTLNASADTQFVRVEALRDSLSIGAPAELDAEVLLTDVTEEQTVALQDSIFRYSGDTYAHNFYTTHDVQPTHTYRLTVRSSEGAESSALVSVPDTFPEPTAIVSVDRDLLGCSPSGATMVVEIRGIERLIAVNALYYMTPLNREMPREEVEPHVQNFGHLADTSQVPDGSIWANIGYQEDLCQIREDFGDSHQIDKIEVVIAAGNPDWPDFMSMDWETVALPGGASNVEGGSGLLGGIVTDTVKAFPL